MCQHERKGSKTSVSSLASPSPGGKNGIDLAECVVCHVVSSKDAKTPGSLKQHLKKSHMPNFNARSWTLMEFFIRRRPNWWQRLASCRCLLPKQRNCTRPDRHLPNRTYLLSVVNIVFGAKSQKKLSHFSL